jgi:hypothetical protein
MLAINYTKTLCRQFFLPKNANTIASGKHNIIGKQKTKSHPIIADIALRAYVATDRLIELIVLKRVK